VSARVPHFLTTLYITVIYLIEIVEEIVGAVEKWIVQVYTSCNVVETRTHKTSPVYPHVVRRWIMPALSGNFIYFKKRINLSTAPCSERALLRL